MNEKPEELPRRDPEDADRLPDPEPLDGDEPEAGEDLNELLRGFGEEGDLDDSTATDLDAGISIDEDDEGGDAENIDTGVDVGELVAADRGEASLLDSPEDVTSAVDDFGATTIDEEVIDFRDDAEGAESEEELLSEELPVLDERADDDVEGATAEEIDAVASDGEDEFPPRAELAWLEVPFSGTVGPMALVRGAGSRVVAAGRDLVVFRNDDRTEKLPAPAGTIVSLIVEPEHGTMILAMAGGELLRIPSGGIPERLSGYRDLVSWDDEQPEGLTLGGPTPSSRPAMLLCVASRTGTLLETTDRGTTWREVALGGRVLALSSGTPPVCLVEARGALRLYRSEPSGGFSATGTEWPLDGEPTAMASSGSVVVIQEAGRGLHVSADAGASFRAVSGTARASAIAAGRLGSRPSAFASLFNAGSGRTAIVWIDAASADAYVIGEIEPDTEDEEDDWARPTSLTWDSDTETLWAAGPFGIRRWRRPPSA